MILRGAYLLRRFLNSARRNEKQAQADRIRDQFYEQCWREAAQSCGAEFARVDEGASWITHKALPRPIYVDRNANVLDSHASVRATDDKPATYQLIEELGAPVPDHIVLASDAHKAALEFIESHGGTFVVKPASGTAGGIGVTANVRTASELRHAMAWAGAYCPRVLVERQSETLPGYMEGRSSREAPEIDGIIYVRGASRAGRFYQVEITGTEGIDQVGRVAG
jgi:hypothetical protein